MSEIVILGAGIIGSAIARELLRRRIPVTLLEKAVPGAESSSAAAGMLAPQLEAHSPSDPATALGLYSRSLYRAFTTELEAESGVHVAHHVDGGLALATGEAELEQKAQAFAWQHEQGLRWERLSADQLHERVPGLRPDLPGGLYFPDEGQIEPRALMRALSVANQRAGVRIKSGQAVKEVVIESGKVVGLELEGSGRLSADRVIVAAGAWSGQVPGVKAPSIEPVRGQMLAISGDPGTLPFLHTPSGYLVPRPDGRVLVGSTAERVGYDKRVTTTGLKKLLDTALSWMPILADRPVLETWAGLRPGTPDGAPLLGATEVEGLYLASGHFRNGILQAPATAVLLADLITGRKPSLDLKPYRPNRFH
jgi:glycine oxidase